MQACPWNFLNDGHKHIISLVGGGGKTTIMYELAAYFARLDRHVVCMTSTHILRPERSFADGQEFSAKRPSKESYLLHKQLDGTACACVLANSCEPIYAENMEQVRRLWQLGRFAVLGSPEESTGKLIRPEEKLLQQALAASDIVLVEADGAKHLPCKVPNEQEPVLLPESDIVIAVAGLDALGNTMEEACFRWYLGAEIFATSCNALVDEQKLVSLLLSEQGSRKDVGSRSYYIALNKCDLVSKEQALALKTLLVDQGIDPNNIWLRNF